MRTIKIVFTILLVAFAGWLDSILLDMSRIAQGHIAAMQFQSSDSAFIVAQAGMRFFGSLHVPLWVVFGMLLGLWYKDLKALFAALLLVSLGFVFIPSQSQAYYDKSDYTEPYYILPNESAFWVPDVGDNKSSQAKMDSEQYYRENKIASKLFTIPHVKLPGSGLWSNFYVPAGRLIIVDRTPYSREWVDAVDRGTSHHKQGFQCQSKEGLNITVGIAIGVNIMPDDAPKYLYNFGVDAPTGNLNDPAVIFTSVLHSRTLTQVMDTVGRNKVQALTCNEIGNRTFDEDNAQATQIMGAVKKASETYFSSVGIHLEYLGWADTMNFDHSIQEAVNDRYRMDKLRPVLDVMTTMAAIDASRKWDGRVPTQVSGLWLLPTDLWNAVVNWFHPTPATPTKSGS